MHITTNKLTDALTHCVSRRRQLLYKFRDDEISLAEAQEFRTLLEKDKVEAEKEEDWNYWFACVLMNHQLDKFIVENKSKPKSWLKRVRNI